MEQEAKNLLVNALKPRPHIIVKPPVNPSVQQDNSEDGSSVQKDFEGSSLPEDDSESADTCQEEGDNERLTQVQSKKPRMQKTFMRDAVKAARSNHQHEADATNVGSQSGRQPENKLRSMEPAPK